MLARWWLLCVAVVAALAAFAACGSKDKQRVARSEDGGAGGVSSALGGSGGAPAAEGGAPTIEGGAPATEGGARELGGAPAAGATADGADTAAGAGGSASGVLLGDLQGLPFVALSSLAIPNDAPSGPYIEMSISGWLAAGCDRTAVCDSPQLNFTLYANGGVLADIVPGSYPVGDDVRGNITFNVVGGAGRYIADCGGVVGNFNGLAAGALTLTSIEVDRVAGSVDFTTADGDMLSGEFDAVVCPP